MKQHWRAEKQPEYLVAAIRKMITALPNGYDEAAEILGVTKDALFNRLRADGDQIFPMGWALVLQAAYGTTHVADAVSRASGGLHITLPDLSNIDNDDINVRLMEAITEIGKYCDEIKADIADGVINKEEKERVEEKLYRATVKLQEHASLVFRVFCRPE